MSPCGKEAAHGSPAQTAALERAQWQLCADAAGGPGQENEALCLSQVVSREGLRSGGQEWAGRTAQVRALKEAQRALRFKLKPLSSKVTALLCRCWLSTQGLRVAETAD